MNDRKRNELRDIAQGLAKLSGQIESAKENESNADAFSFLETAEDLIDSAVRHLESAWSVPSKGGKS